MGVGIKMENIRHTIQKKKTHYNAMRGHVLNALSW